MEPHQAICWKDHYLREPGHVVLTQAELQIPGIRTFGWLDMKGATPALKSHYHQNCFELTFVTKGCVTFCSDGREYAVYGGDAFLTRPNEIHSTNEAPLAVGQICWIQLDVSNLEEFLFLSRAAAEDLVAQLHQVRHPCIRTDNGQATYMLKTLISGAFGDHAVCSRYELASYIAVYLRQVLRFADADGARVSMDIARICEYINQNLSEPLPLEELASVGHLSVSQFKHKFKSQIGLSPRNYVNRQKIDHIKQLLTPDSILTRIASDFGFCNSSYFSVVFKKYTGLTPTEYIASLPAETPGK